MTIRRYINIRIKNKKMEKRSYIFVVNFDQSKHDMHKFVYSRINLQPIIKREWNYAKSRYENISGLKVKLKDNRPVGSKQQYANPRMMQYYWQLLADINDEIYSIV